MRSRFIIYLSFVILFLASCGSRKSVPVVESSAPVGPAFIADSAFLYCQQQCDFGPRTMNSKAHDLCEQWIISKFEEFGMQVIPQKTTLARPD